jgi:hypothetical protein
MINADFEISSREAGNMWVDGIDMPASSGRDSIDNTRLRRSANGVWVIRLNDLSLHSADDVEQQYSAEQTCELAAEEFERLRSCGVDIISMASVPSVLGKKVFTVTPWIDGMSILARADYEKEIVPFLGKYLASAGPHLQDIQPESQYSVAPLSNGRAFLHDTDTRLA